ncbi:MAG: right-handed parallel beta-helix repeat-containing protein [Planctomycetota bacterium]
MNVEPNPSAFLPETNSKQFKSTTFFVDAGAGSDANSGSFKDPFQTIGRAIEQAAHVIGDDSIHVRPGVYNENLEIHDDGGLNIRGLGDQPFDVIINGNHSGNALTIHSGSSIRIENMMFSHGDDGIDAEKVDKLSLFRVRSRNNTGFGLQADNIQDLSITHSNFVQNGQSGARVVGSNAVDVGHSFFNDNGDNGLDLIDNANAKLRHVVAYANGLTDEVENGPQFAVIFQPGNGVSAFENQKLIIRGGHFGRNLNNGVSLHGNQNTSLFSPHANGNQLHGIEGEQNQNVEVFNGLLNRNGGSGIAMAGFRSVVSGTNGTYAEMETTPSNFISVNGTRLWDNGNEGLTLANYERVNLRALHVRRNRFDGVDVANATRVWMKGINTVGNGDDGIDIDASRYITAINSWSAENQGDGFDVDDGSVLYVERGQYNRNGEDGMDFNGLYSQPLYRANVEHAVALDNQGSGINFDDVNYVNMRAGFYARNRHGIDLYNVGDFHAKHTHAKFNRANGLFSDTGVSPNGDGEGDGNNEETAHGRLSLQQSYFEDNGANGIMISSIGVVQDANQMNSQYQASASYDFDVSFDRVIASNNQATGVLFGESQSEMMSLVKQGYDSHVHFDIHFNQGRFNQNGGDGIRAEGSQLFSSRDQVDANLTTYRTTVNNNSGNGLYVDGRDPSINLHMELEKGSFNRNGLDGVSVLTQHDQRREHGWETSKGHGGEEDHLAELNAHKIVALSNGGHGLNYQTERLTEFTTAEKSQFQAAYQGDRLVNIVGGAFHENGFSGINLSVRTDEASNGPIGSLIYIERAIAKRNGHDGLTVTGQMPFGHMGSSSRGIQLELVKGVFNRNDGDGIRLFNLDNVELDRTIGIANKDDGFEGTSLDQVLGDWTFVANQDEDFVLN